MGPREVDDPGELAALFGRHRGVHVYGLADLDEPLWSGSTWWRQGDAAVGRVALDAATDAFYAVGPADPEGTLGLLGEVAGELPAGAAGTGEVGCVDVLDAAVGARPLGTFGRWALRPGGLQEPQPLRPTARPTHGPGTPGSRDPRGEVELARLGPGDAGDVADLHARSGGGVFFRPAMLERGVHVGARSRSDGRLLAAASTHATSATHRVGAIGAVATDVAARRQGLGGLVTHAVAAVLARRGWTVGLNVAEDNHGAQRVYRRLGFVPVHRHEEAVVA